MPTPAANPGRNGEKMKKELSSKEIDEGFALISRDAIGTGTDAEGNSDGSDDWDHPSAQAARDLLLGLVFDFTTWAAARALLEMEKTRDKMKTYKIIIRTGAGKETYYEPRRLSREAREAFDIKGFSYTQRLIDPERERKNLLAAQYHMERAAAEYRAVSSLSELFSIIAGTAQEALTKLENAIAGKMNLEG